MTKNLAGTIAVLSLAMQVAGYAQSGTNPTAKKSGASSAADTLVQRAQAVLARGKPSALVPLTARERAEQLVDRFTFGPRPGEVDRVLAMGTDAWFEQQLAPDTMKDSAWGRHQGDWPTLAMSPEQALTLYPDRGLLQQVADGKRPMPTDPQLAAVYDVQLAKLRREKERRTPDSNGTLPPEPTDAEKTAQKEAGTAVALRVAGQLLALQKRDRMAALLSMPIEERIAFTQYIAGDPRNLLFNDFTPHERELFNGMQAETGAPYRIGEELAQAKMVRAILTERQVQEVMTDFWFNHFNVYLPKDSDQWYTTSYERDAIRKNALGRFSDLLIATAQHPAMLVYLDNWLSIGPDSLANGVNPANPTSRAGNKGLNENYGREVMELHTVGVNGGYTQADVTNLSAVLTGWTVNNPGQAGGFQFDPRRHEPGAKVWLGHTLGTGAPFVIPGSTPKATLASYKSASPMDATMPDMGSAGTAGPASKALSIASAPGNEGMREGLEALNLLAHKPETAHFISWKIAQRFVADDPPPALVDRMTQTFLSTGGDIKAVLRTLVQSPEFNSRRYFRNKVKTPMEFLASAYRTTATEPTNPGALVNSMRSMGMELYRALPPTGYYLTADHWMNSTALVDRLNFADQLTSGRFGGQKFDAAHTIGLVLAQPSAPPAAKDASVVSGNDAAVHILESTMIGAAVSPETNATIRKQLAEAAAQNAQPADLLNLTAGLILGSPEFQLR
jgi:uncharacterized protein (DUF1800 family)